MDGLSDQHQTRSKMFRFLALLALAAVAYGESDVLTDATRIVGGSVAAIVAIPYQLSLRQNHNHFCGATLISSNWAVSAAHCTFGQSASSLSLMGGSTSRFGGGGQTRQVSQVINHPEYNPATNDNDISLLRVDIAFVQSTTVRAASLPSQGVPAPVGAYGVVSGWGFISESGSVPNALQQVSVPVVDRESCNTAYWGTITENMLCAGYWTGGRDACQGDFGGPYAINGQLVGIASWGNGCGRANFPGVYTQVSAFRDWITANTGV